MHSIGAARRNGRKEERKRSPLAVERSLEEEKPRIWLRFIATPITQPIPSHPYSPSATPPYSPWRIMASRTKSLGPPTNCPVVLNRLQEVSLHATTSLPPSCQCSCFSVLLYLLKAFLERRQIFALICLVAGFAPGS
jgi:hypothetical protein